MTAGENGYRLPAKCPKCGDPFVPMSQRYEMSRHLETLDVEGRKVSEWLSFECGSCCYEVRRLCADALTEKA